MKGPRPCRVSTCTRLYGVPGTGLGLCLVHYNRWARHRSLVLPSRLPIRLLTCEYPGCTKPQRGRGYCATHWKRLKRYGDVTICNRVNWTEAEDRRLRDLPRDRDGIVLRGYLLDLCDRMPDRTYSACTARLQKLRQRAAVKLREQALATGWETNERPVNVEAFTGA